MSILDRTDLDLVMRVQFCWHDESIFGTDLSRNICRVVTENLMLNPSSCHTDFMSCSYQAIARLKEALIPALQYFPERPKFQVACHAPLHDQPMQHWIDPTGDMWDGRTCEICNFDISRAEKLGNTSIIEYRKIFTIQIAFYFKSC